MSDNGYGRGDFARFPFLVFYEMTQACDLTCAHCRACAQPARHPEELSTDQARLLIDELAGYDMPPLLVLTGGDPLKREDAFELVAHAAARGVKVAMTPSATPLLTDEAIVRLRDAGLTRLALSLDGCDAATHDGFRGVPGSFQRTFDALRSARAAGLPVQINTTVCRRNLGQIDAIADLIAPEGITLWSVFCLVPVGRAMNEPRLTPAEYETLFEKLWDHARRQPFSIKTTEGPHYRRFVLQRQGDPQRDPAAAAPGRPAGRYGGRPTGAQRAPLGVNDGKGVAFVSHTGRIYPSGFLPIECGQFPRDRLLDVYRHASLMRQLREPDRFAGKCGVCEFRQVCGGSRARAMAVTGDPLASDPDCLHQPAG